ncbi:SseB family protein [Yinghuangia soli]|uniref:SseB family protein n=1 Tax=Yinghuangia soli TaxID=2908204 RepID=A0AA41Q7U8_9ACTN|nr:SseB family protein [Yinghuangia soli]MCF2533209.1 SseB family protein [Yinghuangia soli]
MRDGDFGVAPDAGPSETSGQADDLTELLEQIARFVEGDGDPPLLVAALRAARLYCVKPEHVGFSAIGPAGAGFVPVFTSLEQMALFMAEPCNWFSMPGNDLLRLLPEGYDIAVDLGSLMPVRLHAALWREAAAVRGGHG